MRLPQLYGRRCIGTSTDGGTVVYITKDKELRVLNLVTGECLSLPRLLTLWNVQSSHCDREGRVVELRLALASPLDVGPMFLHFYRKAVVSPSDDGHIVVFIHEAFLSVARTGDEVWTKLECSYGITDVLFHGGRLYAVSMRGAVMTWDLLDPSSFSWSEPRPFGPGKEDFSMSGKYLVVLPDGVDEVFQVWRGVQYTGDTDDLDDPVRYETPSVKVLKLDPINGAWVEVKDLGGHVFFLGHNHSVVLSAQEFPQLRSDCIYFSVDDMDFMFYYQHIRRRDRDMGVFSVESGIWEPLPLPGPIVNYPWPIWVTPSPF